MTGILQTESFQHVWSIARCLGLRPIRTQKGSQVASRTPQTFRVWQSFRTSLRLASHRSCHQERPYIRRVRFWPRLRYDLRTCMPLKDVALGFLCTSKISFLSLTTIRLADGLGREASIPRVEDMVLKCCREGKVRSNNVEWRRWTVGKWRSRTGTSRTPM